MAREMITRLHYWVNETCFVCQAILGYMRTILKLIYWGFLAIGAWIIIGWTFDNQIPYVINNVKVLTPVVAPGEHFKMIIDVNQLRDCQGFVTRSLGGVCGNIEIVTVPTTLPVGPAKFEVHMPVPDDVPDGGICIARYRILYSCNLWQRLFPVNFFLPEIPFTIRKLAPFIEDAPGFGKLPEQYMESP